MKIFRITSNSYPNFLKEKVKKKNLNKFSNFNNYIDIYKNQNFIKHRSLGRYMKDKEIFDIMFNDEISQKIWVRENTKIKNDKLTLDQILFEQIKILKPDIIYVCSGAGYLINENILKEIKKNFKVKLILFWGDEFPENINFFLIYDIIITSNKLYQKKFEKLGIKSRVFPYCIDIDDCLLLEDNIIDKKNKFIFAGETGFKLIDHSRRLINLRKIIDKTDLMIYSKEKKFIKRSKIKIFNSIINFVYLFPPLLIRLIFNRFLNSSFYYQISRRQKVENKKNLLLKIENQVSINEYAPDRIKNGLFGNDYFNLLRNSEIVLNLHRDELNDYANIRCFEVTGSKSCLLTDKKILMQEYFDCDDEVVAFDSIDELEEKYKFLRNNPEKLKNISLAGYIKTINNYTTKNYGEYLDKLINNLY